MRLEKRRPRRALAAPGRRFNAIALQHIGNRPATNLVTEIGQGSLNAGVPPPRIVLRHAHDQLRDLPHDPWPAGPAPTAEVPFLRPELPMPPQQPIRTHYRVEFHQSLAPDGLRLSPKSARSASVNRMRFPRSRFFGSRFSVCRNSTTIS